MTLSFRQMIPADIAAVDALLIAAYASSRSFQEEDTTIAFQLNRPPPSPPIRKNTIESLQPADLAELLALDEPYFGADRSHVFSAYLAAYPGRCFVSRHAQGHVTGYIIGQSDSLGPWLAQSHQEAEALLAYALTLPFQSAPRIRVPASNQQAVELMQTYGFAEVRRLRHMRRGGTRSPQQRACIYALATAAIG